MFTKPITQHKTFSSAEPYYPDVIVIMPSYSRELSFLSQHIIIAIIDNGLAYAKMGNLFPQPGPDGPSSPQGTVQHHYFHKSFIVLSHQDVNFLVPI